METSPMGEKGKLKHSKAAKITFSIENKTKNLP
jgi:hypothetical protein